jgi:hypothetical protein
MDLLLDEEIAELEPEVQQLLDDVQHQQQQPVVTAMDWVLGEYADAAAGSHSLLTVDDEGGYIGDPSSQQDSWGGGYSSSGSSAANAAAAAASTATSTSLDQEVFTYLPAQLGASDLQRLIQQYSWNAEQQPLLLEATLAAGLYPNYAFGKLQPKYEKAVDSLKSAVDAELSGECNNLQVCVCLGA